MSVTKHPKYPNTYIIRYYPEGRKKDPKTGKPSNKRAYALFEGSEEDARDYKRSLLRAPKKTAVLLAPTISDALPDHLSVYKNNVSPNTYRDFKSVWKNHLEPFFGHYRPAHLTTTLIEQYKAHRLSEKIVPKQQKREKAEDYEKRKKSETRAPKKRTINKELSYLSAVITWMSDPQVNHCDPLPFAIKGFPPKQTKAPLPQVPSRREIILLLRHTDRIYRSIFATCYYAGLRKSETLKLKGSDINFSQNYMIIYGKGGKEGIVPIYRKLRVYLRKKIKPGYLWINPSTERPYHDFRRALRRAAEKAGLEQRVYLHLLRHSFGTHSIQSGIDLRTVQLLMRHSSSQVTEIYTNLAGKFLAAELDKFGSGALRQSKKRKTHK